MKFKTNKLSSNLMPANSPLAASIPAFAVTKDTDRPIHIEPDQQSLDVQGNMVTSTGNAIVTQDTVKTNVDKVVVARPGDEQGKEVINGYGKSATSYQMQDNDKPAEGHASQTHYELAKDFVVLAGNVYLQQVDSNIKGDKITYLVKEQKMQVFNDKGRRATIVLVPSQSQDKNNRSQIPAQKEGN